MIVSVGMAAVAVAAALQRAAASLGDGRDLSCSYGWMWSELRPAA